MNADLLIALAATAGVAFVTGWIVGGLRDSRLTHPEGSVHGSQPTGRSRPSRRSQSLGQSGQGQPRTSSSTAPPAIPADRLVIDFERARGIRTDSGRGFRTTSAPAGRPSRPFVPPWARPGVEVKAARARAKRASQSREDSDSL